MSTDKELYKLELLSLVAKVSEELFNHTKLQDKNLAEFVIAVSRTPYHAYPRSYMNKANHSISSSSSSARLGQTYQHGLSKISIDSSLPCTLATNARLPNSKQRARKLRPPRRPTGRETCKLASFPVSLYPIKSGHRRKSTSRTENRSNRRPRHRHCSVWTTQWQN